MDAKYSPVESWLTRSCFQGKGKIKETSRSWLQRSGTDRRDDNLIFVSQGELKRNVTFDTLNNYKDNCSTCRGIINRIQKLITDIEDIKKMETYAICDHCLFDDGKCKRCDYILSKLNIDQRSLLEERYQRFKLWLNKAKLLIDSIMEGEQVCRGRLHRQTFDAVEFENLLRELKTPVTQRHVEHSCWWVDKFTRCKVMLREIIIILKLTEGKLRWSSEGSVNELMNKIHTLEPRFQSVEDVHEPLKQPQVTNELVGNQAKEKSQLKSSLAVSKGSKVKKHTISQVRFNAVGDKSNEGQGSSERAKKKPKSRSPATTITRGNKAIRKPPILTRRLTTNLPTSISNSTSEDNKSKLWSSNQSKSVINDKQTASEENKIMLKSIQIEGVTNDDQPASEEKKSKLKSNQNKAVVNDRQSPSEKNTSKLKSNQKGVVNDRQSASEGKINKVKSNLSEGVMNDRQTASKEKKSKLKSNQNEAVVNDGQSASEGKKNKVKLKLSEGVMNERQTASKKKKSKLKSNQNEAVVNERQSASEENKNKLKSNLSEGVMNDIQTASKEKKSKSSSNIEIDGEETDQINHQVKNETKLELNDGIYEGSVDNNRIGENVRINTTKYDSIIYNLIPPSNKNNTDCIFPEYSAHNVKAGRFENIDGAKLQIPNKGTMLYKLSDKKFVEMGWTQLPTTKVMRRMKVYKMEPARPNWFDQIKDDTTLTYSTGEKLAKIKGHRGKWYYKNGTVALDCNYDYTEYKQKLSIKRYVIYSHHEDPTEPQAVLACFDDHCNGVVYDMNGKERLKYNQSEGQLIDPKIGPPGRWKWHFLNDPPDLQHGLIDTYSKNPSSELEKIMKKHRQGHLVHNTIDFLEDPMVSIELENLANEERAAEEEKYKPNKIKMKAVKINDYFSLRLLEQEKMYVVFKDGGKHLKLNLGMLLKSNTIIGMIVVEAFEVAIPYTNVQSARNIKKKQENVRGK